MTLDFSAEVYVSHIEDGVLTVAFADSDDAAPARYLILQRCLEDDEQEAALGIDTYDVQIGAAELGGYGGIESVRMAADALTFAFSAETPWCATVGTLRVDLRPHTGSLDDIATSLAAVFADRPTTLIRG